MDGISSIKRTVGSRRGQTLIELTLLAPLMLALVFGAIELGSIISAYLTLTQTTREGANLTSRGTDPNVALNAIKTAAAPTIRDDNQAHWKLIYSQLIQDPATTCAAAPCNYIIQDQISSGGLGQASRLGDKGATVTIPGIESVRPRQIFHAIEVFYDYGPTVITYIGKNLINTTFYDRTIFTNVSKL